MHMHMQGSHGNAPHLFCNTHIHTAPSSPHLDKPGSFAQTFPSERDSGECKDGIKCGHKFQVVAEDVVLTWDEEKQQRSLEELARTASSGIKEEPD